MRPRRTAAGVYAGAGRAGAQRAAPGQRCVAEGGRGVAMCAVGPNARAIVLLCDASMSEMVRVPDATLDDPCVVPLSL